MMLQGWYPRQNKGSSTQTQRTAKATALGMGKKFCSQKKADSPTPLRFPGLSHQGLSLLSVSLSPYHVHDSSHHNSGKSKPWALLPWWALMLCTSPLFLLSLTDHFWVLFAIQILQKTLQQPHGTDPGTTPLFVCCTTFWTKRLHLHMPKPKILAFFTGGFFGFFFYFSRALGCPKPTFLTKVLWQRSLRVPGESKFQSTSKTLPDWILPLSPQNYPPPWL